ncbi:MAG TPA: PDZ domain-containing protein [Acidimicrobiales bacterium]|nr:PDZ domain-containing protein [Acidimicrobiales bacterium]
MLALVVLLVAAAVAGTTIKLDYYALAPGSALAVGNLIKVPPDKSHSVPGQVFLTTVSLSQVRAIDYLPDKLSSDVSVVPAAEVLGSTPPSQLQVQNTLEMNDSKEAAQVAALRRLNYPVPETDAGAVVVEVQSGAPAAGKLQIGQTITAIDGRPTPSADQAVAITHAQHPGDVVHLTVEPGGGAPPRDVSITLGGRQQQGQQVAYMGVALSTHAQFNFPFPITINSEGIGGPSAGLAYTLGIIQALTPDDLTGGQKVSATGTIDTNGSVGDVGGVAQKTAAVRNAGATLFLVPPPEYKVAMQHAGSHLKVVPVASLDQALTALSTHGGNTSDLPPPPRGATG